MSKGYPKTAVLRRGAILGGLTHAIMGAANRFSQLSRSWQGDDYLLNNHQGQYGTVAFQGDLLVATMFDRHSERSPYTNTDYDHDVFFRGMPRSHRRLLKARPNLAQELFEKGVRCVTTAFWSEGEYLASADPWEVVLEEGGRLLNIELMEDIEEALGEWAVDMEMTLEQMSFARQLFDCKMANPNGIIELSKADVDWLESTSCEPGEESGMNECREQLGILGIRFPEFDTISSAWVTPTVVALAQAACDNRIPPVGTLDPDRLAILADAIEEAGCDDIAMLNHLRDRRPHVRGCCVLDLLLAKK